MAQVTVSPENMRNAASMFEAKGQRIAQLRAEVEAEMNSLGAAWKGEASSTFQSAMHRFYEDANIIIKTLLKLSYDVEQSAAQYVTGETTASEQSKTLASAIGNGGGLAGV
jgi:WXG100 family type VII secretion target